MVATALAWLLGACTLLWSSDLPGPRTVGLGCVACVLVAAALRRVGVVGFAIGYLFTWVQCGDRLDARLNPALEGTTLQISGAVPSVPQLAGDGFRFEFTTDPAARAAGGAGRSCGRVAALTPGPSPAARERGRG